ncbi:MAG TPA: maleylpyruvate isomerase family mycothiol-dependent enzyme [Actinomycetota bacterium]
MRSIKAERRATLSLLRGLDQAAFDTPTALPGWRIREVIAHLITTDRAALTGSILPAIFLAGSTDKVEAWNERQVPRWAKRSVPDLVIGLDRWGRRFARFAATVPSPVYRPTLPSPWGRGPLALYVWVRTYDEWVHRQDMRRALGMGDEDVDVEGAAEFLLTAIGFQTIHQLDRAKGQLAIELQGAALPQWTFDLTSKAFGPNGATGGSADPTTASTRISAPAAAFIMASAGRDSFEDLTSKGIVRVEGDEDAGRRFLSKLRIV